MGREEEKSQMHVEAKNEQKQKSSVVTNESKVFVQFKSVLEQTKSPEDKIRLTIDFMREVLSQSQPGQSNLKDFWDAKKLCILLFKESIPTTVRNYLWSEYIELIEEVRRLKELLDEQTAFSIEQIEIAIDALEKDIQHFDQLITEGPQLDFSSSTYKFLKNQELYVVIQRELHLLKALIARLNSLRKEMINIDMRISHKNRILKRLSKLGDVIFPKRKELIEQVSSHFSQDIKGFIELRFPSEAEDSSQDKSVPSYIIREEIKSLQAIGKNLTLNNQAFQEVRQLLSDAWHVIKKREALRKQDYIDRTKQQKNNTSIIGKKIEELEALYEKKEGDFQKNVLEEIDKIIEEMKGLSFEKDVFHKFMSSLKKMQKDIFHQIKGAKENKDSAKKEKIETFKKKLSSVIAEKKTLSIEELVEKEGDLMETFTLFTFDVAVRHMIERQFADLKGFILEKKIEKGESLEDFEALFHDQAALVEHIKQQIEMYRKEMGGSALDFEKAMTYRELYDSAKIHLESTVDTLRELEEKLDQIT